MPKEERTFVPNFVKHPEFHYADKNFYKLDEMSYQEKVKFQINQ